MSKVKEEVYSRDIALDVVGVKIVFKVISLIRSSKERVQVEKWSKDSWTLMSLEVG